MTAPFTWCCSVCSQTVTCPYNGVREALFLLRTQYKLRGHTSKKRGAQKQTLNGNEVHVMLSGYLRLKNLAATSTLGKQEFQESVK